MAQYADRVLQAFVIYAEIPHTLYITVPMDWTVGALKKRVNDEMENHMNGLVPGIQLDSEYCDIFPQPPDDTATMQELGAKQLTMIVWPKKQNGRNPSHLREAILNPLLGISLSGRNTGAPAKQIKVQDVTALKEHEILTTKLFEHLHNSSGPIGVALLEKLCQKIAEMQDAIESLLVKTKELEHIIKKQAKKLEQQEKKLEEQTKKLEEQALQINELKEQIKDLEGKHAQQINGLTQQFDKNRAALNNLQAWKNRLALRCLLDQARDQFAVDCQYEDWRDMISKVGAEQARSDVLRTLEENPPHEWEPSLVRDIVSLVVQKNKIRWQRSISAQELEFEYKDILQAIEAVPEGTKRTTLTKLYYHIFRN